MESGERAAVTPTTTGGVGIRVAVTGAAVGALVAARRVRLPFIGEGADRFFATVPVLGSPLALGVTPFVAGFLLVELIALVHPDLRHLRSGRDGRRALARAAWMVALALAGWQGFAHAIAIQGLRAPYGGFVVEPGLGAALGMTAALVAGTAGLGGAAAFISRYGIGDGFAVLFAVTAAEAVLGTGRWMLLQPPGSWSDASRIVGLALVVVVPLVLAHLKREGRPLVPIPTCGLAPLEAPAVVFGFAAKLASWFPSVGTFAAFLQADTWLGTFADLLLTLAVAMVFARLFFPAPVVIDAFRRAGARGPEDAEVTVRAALATATRRSVGLVVGVALIPSAMVLLGFPVAPPTTTLLDVAVVIAVSMDLWAELQARARAPALESAHTLHQLHLVEPALRALDGAGILAFARARRYRTLFHFFAPWTPVEILVPPERVAEAEALCARVRGGIPTDSQTLR